MPVSSRHVFKGKWIQNPRFNGLPPIDVFHKELITTAIPDVPTETLNNHTWFFRRFEIPQDTKALRIDISADDYARVYLNGKLLGMGPAQAYTEDYQYNTYRIHEGLIIGENILAVHVYYQGLRNRAYQSGDNREGMVADIFADQTLICSSDESFLCREAPEYEAGPRIGYDTAFLENINFTKSLGNSALGEGGNWIPSSVNASAEYRYRETADPGLLIDYVLPIRTSWIGNESRILFMDFGEEIVGTLRLKIAGPSGQKVRILCGEELDDTDFEMPRFRMRCNCTYEEFVTLSGNPQGDLCEFFDGKGFRYARVELPPESVFLTGGCTAEVRHRNGATRRIGFETENRDLAAVLKLCERTLMNCIGDSFPDCPQREKGQYVGDFTVSGLAYLYLTGDWTSYKKALRDFADSRKVCPGLLAVAPGALMQEIADYSLQFPLQVWNGYRYSRDRSVLREYLPVIDGILNHFAEYMRDDGLLVGVTDKWNLVDWPANLRDRYAVPLPKPVPPDCIHNVINSFWIGAHIVANRIRRELGLPESNDVCKMIDSFRAVFYNPDNHLYRDGPGYEHYSLHSNVLPVFFGFAEEESLSCIHDLLRQKKLSCGMYFSYFLLKACAKLQDYDLILDLITQRGEAGWLHMVDEGATTLFEAWGKEQKANTSLCHPFGSAPIIAAVEALAPNRPDIVSVTHLAH